MYLRYVKRLLDVGIGLCSMPVLLLVFLMVAPQILLEDKGPIFYNAPRVGKDGRDFIMYKFRSMKVNAPDLLMPDGSTYNGSDDPRMTKIGAFMRKTSLDEMPQFVNVLKGDMSVVGPRPDLRREVELYRGNEIEKLSVKPGVTGYAAAYGRNSLQWHDRLAMDVEYVRNVSFAFDLRIFLHTFAAVLNQEGVFTGENVENAYEAKETGASRRAEAAATGGAAGTEGATARGAVTATGAGQSAINAAGCAAACGTAPRSARKRVAVVTMGVKLGNETKGYDRFKCIATMLAAQGFDVDLITSSFQHWEKAQRDTDDPAYQAEPFHVVFVHEPGYARNIDPRRIASHALAARNLTSHFAVAKPYDVVYAEIPPNDVALACARYCEQRGIPFVADVNDLWPEAMRMVLDVPGLSDALFAPLARDAQQVYLRCAAVVGTSREYAARPLADMPPEQAARTRTLVTYVGNDVAAFDEEAARNAACVAKPANEWWITYAGTLGTSYDIENLLIAQSYVRMFEQERLANAANAARTQDASEEAAPSATDAPLPHVRLMILGGGPLEAELHEKACQLGLGDSVTFTGYLPHEQMAAYLMASDVLVNSFAPKAPQSVATKIGDYLAAGKPMINTCPSAEFCAKVEADGFGVNVTPGDSAELAGAIMALLEHKDACARMGSIARTISLAQFDRPKSYQRIVDLISELTA